MAECRNDCGAPLEFPRPIYNRAGLRRIGYRIGTYTDFREALLRQLDLDPVLAPWTYRGADDPGIALIEAASIVGDILTFYQDTYANELYLPTATLGQSIAGLVRLVGYRLSPGVGGRGVFAFQVTGTKPVVIPARFPISADLAGLPDTTNFETIDELLAVPALSKYPLYSPFSVPSITSGTNRIAIDTAALAGAGITLEKGNRLMLIDPSGSNQAYHQVGVIEKVETRFEQTEIVLRGAWLGPSSPTLTAYKLGRDFRHFGYNAPETQTVLDSAGNATQETVSFTRTVSASALTIFPVFGYVYQPVPGPSYYPLDSAPDDIAAGATFLFELEAVFQSFAVGDSQQSIFAVRQVVSVQKASVSRGPLSGASAVIHINANLVGGLDVATDIRSVQINEAIGGPLTFTAARQPIAGPVSRLYVFCNGQDYQALDGRNLQLKRNKPGPGREEAVEEVTAAITAVAVGDLAHVTLRPVTLQPEPQKFGISEFPLTFPKDNPPVWVYGNLAAATQGKTEKPVVLGNGDSRAAFLTFPIPKIPLTYLLSKSSTPPEVPELVVTVDNLEWKRVPSFLTYGPLDQVYIVREDATGKSFVQFGDGETGSRPPSGVANIAVTYRTGTGAHGALKPGASADAGKKIAGLDSISLLDGATGGADPEDPAKAQQAAPGRIQSLGRLVSLRDFETETLAIPGVAAVSAAWQLVDGVPAVAMTVLMETGRAAELSTVAGLLNSYNVCRGPQRFPIVVIAGHRNYAFVDIALALAPSFAEEPVLAAVRTALADLFSVTRGFGAPEYRSRIEGVTQNVEGVLWNSVTALGRLGPADDPATLVLPASPRDLIETLLPCDSAAMLALHAAHLTLSAVKVPVKAC